MNIYLIKRTDSVSYDEYEGFVVCAKTAESAKGLIGYESFLHKWRVSIIGSSPSKTERVLLSAFNAG